MTREQVAEVLITRLTIPNLEGLIRILNIAPDEFYESLCSAFTQKYPNAAKELFHKEEI